jgi:hypothetical protein
LDVIVNFLLSRTGKRKIAENPTKEKRKSNERKKCVEYGREMKDVNFG